jgi:hypothetical protein
MNEAKIFLPGVFLPPAPKRASLALGDVRLNRSGIRSNLHHIAAAVPLMMGVLGPAHAANILLNPGLDTVGPSGSPVSGTGPSAAQSWNQFTVVPGSTIISQLLASTDPLGGGQMIDIATNAGFFAPAKQGNGFNQAFAALPQATAII